MAESEDYSAAEAEDYLWMDPLSTKKNGGGVVNDNKRRFSDEQVKSLELMFETHTKLEPRKKLQLAKELGLHPRQVAIWFQNKRARWKSKKLEREYSALRAEYDALHSSFESLKNEKQALTKQLHKLAEMIHKPAIEERDQTPNAKLVSSDDDENETETADLFGEVPGIGSSSIPNEEQFCFHQNNWASDQSCTNSQWWEFWPMNK